MNIDIQKYERCLDTIRRRMHVIRDVLGRKKTTGFLITDVELVCVQFRKIVELIALSSLVANKEEYAKQHEKFASHWNAKRIFDDLAKINPDFYPKPSKQIAKKAVDGQTYFHHKPITGGFLTIKDAIELYDITSQILHEDNPFKKVSEEHLKKQFKDFARWAKKVLVLTHHHSLILLNGDMVVGLINPDKVQGTLFGIVKGEKGRRVEAQLSNRERLDLSIVPKFLPNHSVDIDIDHDLIAYLVIVEQFVHRWNNVVNMFILVAK